MSSPDLQTITWISLGLILPGLGLTLILLALYAYAAWYPVSRRHLDRVSFRLLVYALLANLTFGIAFPIVNLAPAPGWRCGFLAFLINLSLVFSAGMFFCIGLNLPLVLAFNLNGQRMEKYYIVGTVLITGVCNVVPYAFGHIGWDAANKTCWYRSTDSASRLRWFVGTQTVWMLLASFGEVVAFLTIVGHLVAYELVTGRRFRDEAKLSGTYSSSISRTTGSTIHTFRNIILRIGLYPVVSCLLNISTSLLDLHELNAFGGPEIVRLITAHDDLALFSVRPLIYGLLAATDPSFLRALRELRSGSNRSSEPDRGTQGVAPCFSTVLELHSSSTVTENSKHEDFESLELRQTTRNSGTSGHGGEEERERLPLHVSDPMAKQGASVMNELVCQI
ncbi:hypothetical protein B0H17DRAFT_1102218 [Mycena rosella]|uniref:G-protein coupled receptors family 2 profile 2 domain-containing protein n=1 Tax=Mycena rosella TaxID=1033263 RepID=A0AAD7CHN0_MYCRO|nr:hypothetical protein B0H17DRAFT_1102218 [Mycena rosella]